MPVILTGRAMQRWLDPESSTEDLLELCVPLPAERMVARPVSVRVNDPAHDGPDCVEPVAVVPRTPSLFD